MKKRGFTLIEILIVLIIIGILATLTLPQMEKIVEKARKAEALTNLSAIYSALRVYQLEKDVWPGALADHAAINTTLGVGVGNRYFNYSVTAANVAQATRVGGTWVGNYILRSAQNGQFCASPNNPWGIDTSWE